MKKRDRAVVPTRQASLKSASESWQVQTAKARFSEVFRRARTEGPQRITKQGKESVVMVAEEQYERLVGRARQPANIVDFFRQSPLMGLELDLKRDRSPVRDVDL
jgi:prevent-host-death family protein